ncbi:unnamed protein product, partial [Polarella glacialis]
SMARTILVVEKETVFHRLLSEGVLERHRPCVIVTAKGFPDVPTRYLLRRLREDCARPRILVLVDFDASGLAIAATYAFGPESGWVQDDLTLPEAVPLFCPGGAPSAAKRFGLRPGDVLPMTRRDRAVAEGLLRRVAQLRLRLRPEEETEVARAEQEGRRVTLRAFEAAVSALLEGGVNYELDALDHLSDLVAHGVLSEDFHGSQFASEQGRSESLSASLFAVCGKTALSQAERSGGLPSERGTFQLASSCVDFTFILIFVASLQLADGGLEVRTVVLCLKQGDAPAGLNHRKRVPAGDHREMVHPFRLEQGWIPRHPLGKGVGVLWIPSIDLSRTQRHKEVTGRSPGGHQEVIGRTPEVTRRSPEHWKFTRGPGGHRDDTGRTPGGHRDDTGTLGGHWKFTGKSPGGHREVSGRSPPSVGHPEAPAGVCWRPCPTWVLSLSRAQRAAPSLRGLGAGTPGPRAPPTGEAGRRKQRSSFPKALSGRGEQRTSGILGEVRWTTSTVCWMARRPLRKCCSVELSGRSQIP